MPVYVDAPINPFGRMMMCHMIADTLPELHAMADKIGIQRKWFQNKSSVPHYDICKSKRSAALRHGAIEIDRQQTADLIRKLRRPLQSAKN